MNSRSFLRLRQRHSEKGSGFSQSAHRQKADIGERHSHCSIVDGHIQFFVHFQSLYIELPKNLLLPVYLEMLWLNLEIYIIISSNSTTCYVTFLPTWVTVFPLTTSGMGNLVLSRCCQTTAPTFSYDGPCWWDLESCNIWRTRGFLVPSYNFFKWNFVEFHKLSNGARKVYWGNKYF